MGARVGSDGPGVGCACPHPAQSTAQSSRNVANTLLTLPPLLPLPVFVPIRPSLTPSSKQTLSIIYDECPGAGSITLSPDPGSSYMKTITSCLSEKMASASRVVLV